jgi:DNA transformation protein
MFALAADDVVYLKVDDALKAELAEAGSEPFLFTPSQGPNAGKPSEMGYWRLPDDAFDDPEEAAAWGRKALAVARAAKAKKSKPKRKTS